MFHIKTFLSALAGVTAVLFLAGAPLAKAEASASPASVAAAPDHVVKGRVTDATGAPLPGASVIVKGARNRGVITGIDGSYSIEVSEEETLVFDFLGFITQEVRVGGQSVIDVVLSEDTESLAEIVVVGYSPMRKSDFTGSISSVKSGELPVTVPTVGQALAGKVAGVEVRQASGAPGDGVTLRVRGVNSLTAGSTPLYVVDGYPASEDVYINPNDIESIDILKDAASAAIYGSRGASGVVLITTKRGAKNEDAKVSYDFSYGVQTLERKAKLLNAEQFRDLIIDAKNNTYRLRATAAGVTWDPLDDNATRVAKGFNLSDVGIPDMFFDFVNGVPKEQEYDTDWQALVYTPAGVQRHNVSVRGGTQTVRYMASVGYMDQDGIIAPSNHKRLNARLNLDAKVSEKLNVSFGYSMYDASNVIVQAAGRCLNDGIVQSTLMYLPNLPAFNEDGSYARSAMINLNSYGINFPENPLVVAHELDQTEKMSRHNVNINATYTILDGLDFSARLGQQWYNYRYFYYRPMSIGRGQVPAYSADLAAYNISHTTSTYDIDRLGEFTLNYKKQLGKHHLDLLAGYTMQKKEYDRVGVEATGFADDRIHEVTAHGAEASDVSLYSTRKAAWSMLSYLTRLNWSYNDTYTFTGTFRADGSSRFGAKNRWGIFPSVSAGWTVTNEQFIKDIIPSGTSLRLRASWGKSGNNDIGNYSAIAAISSGAYAFGNTAVSTAYEGSFVDEGLGWETTTQTNLGFDLGLFGDRVNLIGNWYNSISSDILYSQPISSISGSSSTQTNLSGAKIRNRGFDLQLDTRILQGVVDWTVSANVSVNRNKVVDMGGLDDIISVTERSVGSHITKEGYPIGSFYGYKAIGIMSEADYFNALIDRQVYVANGNSFPEGYTLRGPAQNNYDLANLSYGNVIWEDVNGDNLITTDDKQVLGDAYPDLTGGFSTTLRWNGIDFSANLTYSIGAEVINFHDYYCYNMEGSGNQYACVADRYISDEKPGKNNIPLAERHSTTNTNNKLPSYYVEDASYLRLANVTLGYTLPKALVEKVKVSNVRVYVSGDNLFCISPYRGYNPEISYKSSNLMPGFDWGGYPLSRIVSGGVNITF